MSINDGGPAFPQSPLHGPNGEVVTIGAYVSGESGMSLRDWFAGQALTAVSMPGPEGMVCTDPVKLAGWAYALADAMLKARGHVHALV